MLIAGIILIVIAAAAFFVGRGQRSREREATATETMSCADISALASGVGAEVGGGSFHQRCEVVGQAAPGTTGRLAFAKPSQGRYIISTRSEEQIVGAARRNAGVALTAAAPAATAGGVLVVLGALA